MGQAPYQNYGVWAAVVWTKGFEPWEMDYGSCIAGVGLWALNRRAHIMDCRIYPNTVPYYEVSDLSEIGWNKGLACGHLP